MDTIESQCADYGCLVAHHAPLVRAICRRWLSGPECDDIAQEALLRALQSRPRTTQPGRVRSYLRTITQNLVVDLLRARAVRRRELPLGVGEEPPAVATADGGVDVVVRRALSQLAAALEHVAVAFYVDGRSYREIAAELGVSTAIVGHRLNRARTDLRRLLAGVAPCRPTRAARPARSAAQQKAGFSRSAAPSRSASGRTETPCCAGGGARCP